MNGVGVAITGAVIGAIAGGVVGYMGVSGDISIENWFVRSVEVGASSLALVGFVVGWKVASNDEGEKRGCDIRHVVSGMQIRRENYDNKKDYNQALDDKHWFDSL